jgi:RNA polymerase sigma factor (sigma-70 family)
MNDIELLRCFRETGSDEAFRELVHRHLGMVYSVAFRQVRNADWADEVAHAVFIALARKARFLSDRTILAGWLYRATRFAASKLLRDEERRARHEKEAAMASLNARLADEEEISRADLGPLILEEVGTLSAKDRDAVLMRFIENCSFADVATAIGTSEAAAKMRTGRALEKLRTRLRKRGAAVLGTSLAAGLTAACLTPPSSLASSVSSAALGQAAASASATALAGSVMSAFGWVRLKIASALAALLIAGAAITTLIATRTGSSPDLAARPDDIARSDGWTVDGRNAQSQARQGRDAIEFDGQPDLGIAWRKKFNFSDGVMEADIAAITGHVGLAFWVEDSRHYSAVYFRPQNRPEDPVNGQHGIQYVALPDYGWERLRRETPGVYENPVSLPAPDLGAWFHVRLEISPRAVRAYVNYSIQPCLVVTNLLTTNTTGSVGLFMGTGSSGTFSNFKAQPRQHPR